MRRTAAAAQPLPKPRTADNGRPWLRGSFTDAHCDRRGILESAHRGTVLLDEIGEMGMRMQTLLMRFLHKHDCHLPIQPFRMLRDLPPPAPGAADAPTIASREN